MTARDANRGAALITVLAVVVAGSALVTGTALRLQDGARQTALAADASQASQLLQSLEAGLLAALAADRQSAPEADSLNETWAKTGNQRLLAVGDAQIAVVQEDPQARFNLGNLHSDPFSGAAILRQFVAAGITSAEVASRIRAAVRTAGPMADIAALKPRLGLTEAEFAKLAPWVTVLPRKTAINLNTASDAMLRQMISYDTATADAFLALRKKKGIVTPDDLLTLGIILPPGTGLTSDFIAATIVVRSGSASLRSRSLIFRPAKGQPVLAQRSLEQP